MNSVEIIKKLEEGNSRFINGTSNNLLKDKNQRLKTVDGQSPWAIVLSCVDSRVVPEFIFDTGLGELFVIRVAGNIANTDSIASIEYAVAHLKSKVIIVMGHESCGAVGAAMQGGDNGYNLNHLLAQLEPAKAQSDNHEINTIVKKNAQIVCRDLYDRSKIISEAVDANHLTIVPTYYNFKSGIVDFL